MYRRIGRAYVKPDMEFPVYCEAMQSWGRWLSSAALALGILLTLFMVGPSGRAYRTDDAFSACVAAVEGETDPHAQEEGFRACTIEYCSDWEPSRVELMGIWVRFRVSQSSSGASCVGPPELADILLP